MKFANLICLSLLVFFCRHEAFALAEFRIPRVPAGSSLTESVKLTTKEKLTEDTRVIQGTIEVIVPKGWGVKGGPQDSRTFPDLLELFPEGTRVPGLWSAFSVTELPKNVMTIYRLEPNKYRPLTELLQLYQEAGNKKVPARTTLDLRLRKMGALEWLVHIFDGEKVEEKNVQTWHGITNVEKTPFRVQITYLLEEKDRLGREMIDLVSKLSLKRAEQ